MADERFSALATDPRYRLPSRKQARTAVDPRFKTLFTDQGFRQKASVDRYGRKVNPEAGRKDLERLYRLEKEKKAERKAKTSAEVEREVVGSSEEDASEESSDASDGEVRAETRDAAREGGFSESSSEESTSEDESDSEAELAEETAGIEQTEDVPMGEVSHRIAAVNLDWDNIRASDIMAVASSFVPSNGNIMNVTIYPSEFGRERMEREELEGPPREIFASSHRAHKEPMDSDEDEDSEEDDEKIKKRLLQEQANEGDEFDTAKLRQYQLERLRYYYAVVACDNKITAKTLYDSMDGREYLTTSNFFDLRFIPDETTFYDDKPRDECTKLQDGYKPNDFRTEALTHSKVRLTWDDDDTTRKEVQKRAFSRAEMDENDLQAYIGSDSSDAGSVASRKSAAEDRKAKKREAERQKMRSALGLAEEPLKSSKKANTEPVGDMQVTFSAGLSASKTGKGVFENEPQDEESTRARYIRKERERKQKRKEKMKGAHGGEIAADAATEAAKDETVVPNDDDPFNDPFFTDPAAAANAEKIARKANRQKKREAKAAEEEAAAARKAELELLTAADKEDDMRHFDMKEIEKAEKRAKRKGKKSKKPVTLAEDDETGEVKDGFQVETEDPRFKALFDSHEYAIDPSNPKFKGTEGMKALLEEGRKKRKRKGDDTVEEDDEPQSARMKKTKAGGEAVAEREEVDGLVARLKTKRKA